MTAGILTTSRLAPGLVARFGARALLITGTTGLVACFAWLSLADPHSNDATAVFGPVLLNGLAAAAQTPAQGLPATPVRPVTDTYFGRQVTAKCPAGRGQSKDRKSTRLNSSH